LVILSANSGHVDRGRMKGLDIPRDQGQFIPRREALKMIIRLASVAALCTQPARVVNALSKVEKARKEKSMHLPTPKTKGTMSLEAAVQKRRTVRDFSPKKLSLEQLSQLLWAAQGITEKGGFKRAAPSAGALYPMEVFVLAGRDTVMDLDAGIYRYESEKRSLSLMAEGDRRQELAKATLAQFWLAKAPVNLVICAEYRRITGKYGERGERYAVMESGFIAQNIFLQAYALGLVAGIAGAFMDAEVRRVLGLEAGIEPLLIIPVGFG